MIELQQTTKDGKTFHELTINGTATGRGSYDSDSARLICRNEQNKAETAQIAENQPTSEQLLSVTYWQMHNKK